MTDSIPSTTERAIVYSRVSSERQGQGFSLSTQLEGCRAYCERQGYTVVEEFSDQFTGTTHERPGLMGLLDYVANHPVDVVCAWDVDRLLGRDQLAQVLTKREIFGAGARIEYAMDGTVHREDDDDLLSGIKELLARGDNRKRAEAARRGQRGRLAQGYPLVAGAGPPYGYRYVAGVKSGHLEIDEDEARVVRDIYRWLVDDGLSIYQIAQRLHGLGVPSRADTRRAEGKRARKETGRAAWSPSTVAKILNQSAYRGEWVFGKTRRVARRSMVKPDGSRYKTTHTRVATDPSEWIVVEVPTIVDADTWHRAQEQLSINKQFSKPPRRVYLLRGMVTCGECGKRWVGSDTYYRCGYSSAKRKPWYHNCSMRKIRADRLEAAVWEYVMARLLNPEALRADIERRRSEEAEERSAFDRQVRALDAELRVVNGRLAQLLDQALDGFPADVIHAKREELTSRRDRLTREREQLVSARDQAVIGIDDAEEFYTLALETWNRLSDLRDYRRVEEQRATLRKLRLDVTVLDPRRVRVTGVLSPAVLSIPSRWNGQETNVLLPFTATLDFGDRKAA